MRDSVVKKTPSDSIFEILEDNVKYFGPWTSMKW